jgi:hypothetical protein
MDLCWLVVLHPLALPSTMALVGGLANRIAFRRYRASAAKSGAVAVGLTTVAIFAAWIPSAGQVLFDAGMSFPAIDVLQTLSYFVFAFAVAGAWRLFRKSWQRALLALLIPVSFAQPLLWTWAYISWSIWGFAP